MAYGSSFEETMISSLFCSKILNTKIDCNLVEIKKFCLKIYKQYPSVYNKTKSLEGYKSDSFNPGIITKNKYLDDLFNKITSSVVEINNQYGFPYNLNLRNFWVNVNEPRTFNSIHNHHDCVFSGVFYVDIPKDSGNLYFVDPQASLLEHNPLSRFITTKHPLESKNGYLVLFPSWTLHAVEMNASKHNRISIAFDYSLAERMPLHV
jgi:uncharacterized protein (TIGR02466 family)